MDKKMLLKLLDEFVSEEIVKKEERSGEEMICGVRLEDWLGMMKWVREGVEYCVVCDEMFELKGEEKKVVGKAIELVMEEKSVCGKCDVCGKLSVVRGWWVKDIVGKKIMCECMDGIMLIDEEMEKSGREKVVMVYDEKVVGDWEF